MDEPPAAQALARDVTPGIRQGIVNALDQAYEVRRSFHDPSIGDDAQYFGFGVSKSNRHFLEAFVEEDAYNDGVRILQPGQRFRLLVGRVLLAPYGIPNQSEQAFPYNSEGAGQVARLNQRRLSQSHMFEDESKFPWDLGPRFGIVVAHTGGPHAGLTSVSFREPVAENDGRICKWGYIEEVWPDSDEEAGGNEPAFPPEEPVSPPSVAVRNPPDIKSEHSAESKEQEEVDSPTARSDET